MNTGLLHVLWLLNDTVIIDVNTIYGRIKKQSCFSSLPPHFWVPHHLFFFFFFFFFFYKNADNALEIELKRSKIEMPLSFLEDFYT